MVIARDAASKSFSWPRSARSNKRHSAPLNAPPGAAGYSLAADPDYRVSDATPARISAIYDRLNLAVPMTLATLAIGLPTCAVQGVVMPT